MILDGVMAVVKFRDDGVLVEGYGMRSEQELIGLAHFAHDYKRIVQGNADQLSMFSRVRGFTPPRGWIVHGAERVVCSTGNLVCLVQAGETGLNEIMRELDAAAHM